MTFVSRCIQDLQYRGEGETDGLYWDDSYFLCEENCGLYVTLSQLEKPSSNQPSYPELQYQLSQLSADVCQIRTQHSQGNPELNTLQEEMRDLREALASEQQESRQNQARRARDIEGHERVIAELRNTVGLHAAELNHMRQELTTCRQQIREEQAQRSELASRLDRAGTHLQGSNIELNNILWELPRHEVQVSQTLLGTGGWGSVYRGTYCSQAVAVKCLHRAILSPENEGRVRREISIMSQVRHPNLLLLIGAVLTVEGAGPLIVTELLDTSLRSAYERGVLEERSKVPVLRDVASALVYLHSQRTPILHRDVSSANILLEAIRQQHTQWKAKLSDFGSANLSHLASTPAEGAAVYAAPEVSTEDRSRQTAKIDVYSFGVLVCEVCLCRFPGGRGQLSSMLGEVHHMAPHLFPLSRDCTSRTHQDRPSMREALQRLDQA